MSIPLYSSGQLGLLTFDNSVSEELLCAFELLKPLDGPALRKEMTKAKRKRWVLCFVVLAPHIDSCSSQHDGHYDLTCVMIYRAWRSI